MTKSQKKVTQFTSSEMKKKPYYRDETNAECWVVAPPPVSMSDEAFQRMTWANFAEKIDKKDNPELIEYLKLHDLYINEAITGEEDI